MTKIYIFLYAIQAKPFKNENHRLHAFIWKNQRNYCVSAPKMMNKRGKRAKLIENIIFYLHISNIFCNFAAEE